MDVNVYSYFEEIMTYNNFFKVLIYCKINPTLELLHNQIEVSSKIRQISNQVTLMDSVTQASITDFRFNKF